MAALHAPYLLFVSFLFSLVGALPGPHCLKRCGDIEIPYPFGIGSGCSMDASFQIECNNSNDPPKAFLANVQNRSEVIQIQIPESQVRVKYPYLARAIFPLNKSEEDLDPLQTWPININLSSTPYSLSDNNVVTVLGCDDFVRINKPDYFAGCMSICNEKVTNRKGTCLNNVGSSYGCCKAKVPKGTTQLSFNFTDMHEHSRDDEKRLFPWSYIFVGEQGKNPFSYALSGLNDTAMFRVKNPQATTTTLVLNWRFKDQNCSGKCGDPNSQCIRGGTGYICRCNKGYKGNPYLPGQCQEIDECAKGLHDCISASHCKNTAGGYRCFCPRGYTGNGTRTDGCSRSTLSIAIIGVGSGIGFILVLAICYCSYIIFQKINDDNCKRKFFKRNGGLLLQQQRPNGTMLGNPNLFTAKELEKATDHFNEARILGQGGHGTVYKGILSDGRIVAIKKAKLLDENQQEQFINETVILSQINHKHVVKLLGCCLETQVPLLVYEYVPNGTLSNLIHHPTTEFPFTWNMRLKIATDVAGAIAYLHSASSIPIYHRDIKSSNLLLDEKFAVKVSDFGASRLVPVDQTHLTTLIAGTFGYLDPEYFQTNQFTEKSDVYSFGVVLVELLTGSKPLSFNRDSEQGSLATHFLQAMEANHVDKILDDQVFQGTKEDVMAVARLAKKCLNLKGRLRPTMKTVVAQLESIMKSHMAASALEEDDGDHQDVGEHESKVMMLSSFDYTWTTSSMPSSPAINHPLIKGKR